MAPESFGMRLAQPFDQPMGMNRELVRHEPWLVREKLHIALLYQALAALALYL